MGLKGAPSHFQAMMARYVLTNLIYNICDIYIDDIIIYGSAEEKFLKNFTKVLEQLRQFNIFLNPKKAKIGLTKIEYVGHTVSGDGLSISDEKRNHVLDVPLPTSQKELKNFLGLVSNYRDHLRSHSETVQRLHSLLLPYQPRLKRKWTDELKKLFYRVQESVNTAPPLFFMDINAPVYLHADASDFGIGAHLFQVKDNASAKP